MKILLTGGTGQVGWELQRTLMTIGEVISVQRQQMDLLQPDSIRCVVRAIQPDLIVNAAAYTEVDKAELEPDLAMAINAIAPAILAEEAKKLGAAIIHYSTDYVFSGISKKPYTETDPQQPQNIYGKTKLLGEIAVASVEVPHLILRISWIYSQHRKNFLLTMRKLAQEQEEIRVVSDQIGSPTWSRMIAEVTAQILSQAQKNVFDFLFQYGGLYHLAASGETNWYEFAQTIFAYDLQYSERKLKKLIAIPTKDYPTLANRPAYSLLDCRKLSKTFGIFLPHWQQSLKLMLNFQ